MELDGDIFPLGLICAGAFLGLIARKRRFDRINRFGVERFQTFIAKLMASTTNALLLSSATVLFGCGTIMLAGNHLQSWGWIVMLPVVLLSLYLLLGT